MLEIAHSTLKRGALKGCLFVLCILFALPGQAASLPTTLGWYQIPATTLAPNCPSPLPGGNTGCAAVISAQNGAIADTIGTRLIIWGGGHNDYYGNEVYSLNLGANPITMTRLTSPSVFDSPNKEAQSDGNPTSRHTYDNLVFLPNTGASGRLFTNGGALSDLGNSTSGTWTFDLATHQWNQLSPGTLPPPDNAGVNDWDPNTNQVFLFNTDNSDWATFWSFDPASNTFTRRGTNQMASDLQLGGAIDPGRKVFVTMGGGKFFKVDISAGSSYTIQDISGQVTGCSALMGSTSPGLAYDPVQQILVAWMGGSNFTLFNPDSSNSVSTAYGAVAPMSCLTVSSYTGGPGAQQGGGTFGRFRYFPSLGVFVVVNDWQTNAYALRLTNGTTPPPPSPCDVNGDGSTNVADVQSEVNMALGISTCTNVSGVCTVVSVQRVVNAALGGTCVNP